MTEKLQKVLARAGVGSRRQMEQWIEAGRIVVNGKSAHLGMRVDDSATILVDDRHVDLSVSDTPEVIAYHKPVGEICTRYDNVGRPTVFDNLPKLRQGRWVSVGRLDINTSGLLLLTTDGELANKLMHPSHEIEREYACRVHGKVTDNALQQLRDGIVLDGKKARFHRIDYSHDSERGKGSNQWYNVILCEGRYREVRRLWEAVGCQVSRLIRIRYGIVKLPAELQPGKWKIVSSSLIKRLQAL